MKKTFTLLIVPILMAVWILCLSCGSRKVSIDKQKEEVKTEITDKSHSEGSFSENIKSETKIKVDDKNETVTTETVYSVINPEKEAFIVENDGTKTKLSNVVKTIRVKKQKNNTQTNTEEKKEEAKQSNSKQQNNIGILQEAKKEYKQKEIEKKQFNWLSLWWVYLIILGLIYGLWRIFVKK